jgi:outer membrane protein, heavy metal efflux system
MKLSMFRKIVFISITLTQVHIANATPIKDYVQMALTNNNDLKSAKLNLQKAEVQLKQSSIWHNPEIEISRNTDSPFNNEGEYAATTSFKQKFPVSSRLKQAKNIAKIDLQMAKIEILNQERLLVAEISAALRALFVIDEKIKNNLDLQTATKKLIDASEKRLASAEISVTEINLQKLELEKLFLSSISFQNERITTTDLLKRLTNQAFGTFDSITDDSITESLIESNNSDYLLSAKNNALTRRPDRELAVLLMQRTTSEINLAKAERWEDWTVGLEYSQDKSKYETDLIPSSRDEFLGLSISIPLPLWNQNNGNITLAEINKSKARLSLESLELQIQTEIESAYSQIIKLTDAIKQHKSKSLLLAEENMDLIYKSYNQGQVGINVVLQAQQQLSDIKQANLELLDIYYKALTNFETATASSPYWENTL